MLGLTELLDFALRKTAAADLSGLAVVGKPGGKSSEGENADRVTALVAASDKRPSWLGALSEGLKDLAAAVKPGGRSASSSKRRAEASCCG